MEAVTFELKKKELKFTKLDIPKITEPNQILIKVAYAGICGTDLHSLLGHYPMTEDKPVVLGHEFSGVVVTKGDSVDHLDIGDHVVVDPNGPCYTCNHCNFGEPHFCINLNRKILGFFKNGGWAQYCVAPNDQVKKISKMVPLNHAALCEPLSCVAHGLTKPGFIPIGKTILIQGAGIIGNLWAVTLHLLGHRKVTISEPNINRLNQIKKLNLGYELITPDELKNLRKNNTNFEFDIVVDTSGFGPAIEFGIELLKRGGKFVQFGVASPGVKVSIEPYEIYRKEAVIVGVQLNPYSMQKAMGLIEAMGDRYLNFNNLGIKEFSLKEYEQAINELKAGSISKAMFKL